MIESPYLEELDKHSLFRHFYWITLFGKMSMTVDLLGEIEIWVNEDQSFREITIPGFTKIKDTHILF